MLFNINYKELLLWSHRLMQRRRLMVIVKYVLPFLVGVLHPHLSLLAGFSIFLWDLSNIR